MGSPRDPLALHYFQRYKVALDTRPLRQELERSRQYWCYNAERQNDFVAQREARGVFLINADTGLESGISAGNVQACNFVDVAQNFPIMMLLLEEFAAERRAILQRTLVVRIQPHGRVYPHIDSGAYYDTRDRYHLVLDSRHGSVLSAGDHSVPETVTMLQGELWWFDNRVVHWSDNSSDSWRTHIIFDLLPHLMVP